jgi:protein TonB
MAAYAQDSGFFTRRGIVVVLIIALHISCRMGTGFGLARKVVEVLAPPIEADIVEEVKQEDTPPPPPPPEMERPPVEVPPPEVSIDLPMETTSTAIQDVTDKTASAGSAAAGARRGFAREDDSSGEPGRLLPAGIHPP